jgi:CcmD family protein
MLFVGRLLTALALQPPSAQTEFVPVAPGTATEHLPAGPLLVAAYAFVWLATLFYLWTIWRRLNKVEAEIRALEARQGHPR